MKKYLILIFVVYGSFLSGQTCDLGFEDFETSSNTNPPAGWIRGAGTNLGTPFNGSGIAVGFNNVGEYMISKEYICNGQICFGYRASGGSSDWDMAVYYGQGDDNANTVWNQLEVISTNGSNSPTSFVDTCINIPEGLLVYPFDVRIKWEMTRRDGGTAYFDDVCANSGTCILQPTKFSFTDIPNGCKLANTPINITVCATDDGGNIAETYSDNIELSVSSGSGTIGGTISGDAVNGCFQASVILSSDDVYQLGASSLDNSLTGTSGDINVVEACPLLDSIRVMSYNVLNFPLGRNDCSNNTVIDHRWDTLSKIIDYILPDVLMICELQNEWGADSILLKALNTNGRDYYLRADFVQNQSTGDTIRNNMLFYNSNKLTLHAQDEILTNTRDFNKYILYGNDPGLASHQDTTFIDFYMSHLKAGPAPADSTRRSDDCQILRNYLDARPERNNVLGGDLNLYTNTEQAYTYLTTGTFPFEDPLNLYVNWENDPSYGYTHTQSSRSFTSPTYDCGINGGCDSRFDFLLASSSIINNTDSVEYISGTYKVPGNDGSIFNKSINDPSNTSGVPVEVLDALFYMSDHLPVLMDLELSYQQITTTCGLVANTSEQDVSSLRNIINCNSSGGDVLFDPLLADSTIIITDSIVVLDKNVKIRADINDSIRISASQPLDPTVTSLFQINSGKTVTIEGLILEGGFGPEGTAIINYGNLVLKDVVIESGDATSILSVIKSMPGSTLTIQGNCKINW